jgi:hypothetical protein
LDFFSAFFSAFFSGFEAFAGFDTEARRTGAEASETEASPPAPGKM